MKIVLINSLFVAEEKLLSFKTEIEKTGNSFVYYLNSPIDVNEYIDRIKDADILIIDNLKTPESVLKHAKNLKYIDVAFTGVDHLDLAYCKKHGIIVSNASGYSTEAVAELVVGLIISYYRKVIFFNSNTRLLKDKESILGNEIENLTIGLIGYGKIAKRVYELLNPFHLNFLVYSHHEVKDLPNNAKFVTLDELFKSSDIITLHTPLTNETHNLINLDAFNKMNKKPLLINTARGPIINHDDLVKALDEKLISGAAIDVYDKEPPLNKDDQLLKFENLILLPHVGYFTKEAMAKRFEIIKDNLASYLKGETKNRVA